jgi:hypothetical protein
LSVRPAVRPARRPSRPAPCRTWTISWGGQDLQGSRCLPRSTNSRWQDINKYNKKMKL